MKDKLTTVWLVTSLVYAFSASSILFLPLGSCDLSYTMCRSDESSVQVSSYLSSNCQLCIKSYRELGFVYLKVAAVWIGVPTCIWYLLLQLIQKTAPTTSSSWPDKK